MGSFSSITFQERGSGTTFPIWGKAGIAIIKKIPGGNLNIIQKIGLDMPRLALVVRVTAAQLASLRGVVGDTASLVFGYETTTAQLESITDAQEVSAGRDTYFVTLNLLRTTGTISGGGLTSILAESGDTLTTEAGDTILVE